MTDRPMIESTVTTYMAAMTAGDRDRWVGCYSPDATIEDPVGSEVVAGSDALGAFFDNAHAMADGIAMEPTGPIRVAAGQAAIPFRIITTLGEDRFVMPVIDVMTFDDDGRITTMRAFWDMADMTPLDG